MSSYHGWTHRPKEDGGTDPVPFPGVPNLEYAAASETGSVIATATLTQIDFVTTFTSEPLIFGSAATAHNPTSTTCTGIYVYLPGIYIAGCHVKWPTGNFTKASWLQMGSDPSTTEPILWGGNMGFGGGTADDLPANMSMNENQYDTTIGPLHWHFGIWKLEGTSTTRHFSLAVKHQAGSNRTINYAKLGVMRLGDLP